MRVIAASPSAKLGGQKRFGTLPVIGTARRSHHLIFYSLKTLVKRNCVQSSYTYRYNKMLGDDEQYRPSSVTVARDHEAHEMP